MAVTTPNLGLRKWDQQADPFSYTELANNWSLIDVHDHTTGKGVQVPTNGLVNAAVTNSKLANLAVDTGKLADLSVTGAKVAANTLSYTNLAKDGSGPGVGSFSAYLAGAATVATAGTLILDTLEWDLSGWYSTSTGRFTPQVKGVYLVTAQVTTTASATSTNVVYPALLKNGATQIKRGVPGDPGGLSGNLVTMVDFNGTTDYINMTVIHNFGGSIAISALASSTFFQAHLIARRT
jgi:hypothetical protein